MIDYNTHLQTIAAISSAIAAIFSMYAVRSMFTFQKNSLLKQSSIAQILRTLQQFYYLKSLTGQSSIETFDDNVTGLKKRILELNESVMVLESMISNYASEDVKKIRDVTHQLREENFFAYKNNMLNTTLCQQLDSAIITLQHIYHSEIR
jgi:putative flippase GtrA